MDRVEKLTSSAGGTGSGGSGGGAAGSGGRRSVTLVQPASGGAEEGNPGEGQQSGSSSSSTMAGASTSSSSSSSVSVRPTRRLLRVVVVDYPTGIALFDHAWTWKGDPNLPGVAKVIVALYKLSQSLGGKGDANYVLFDPPPEGRRRSQQDLYTLKAKRASGGAGLRPMAGTPRSRKPRIRCVFSRTDHAVVALFHEIGDKLELPKQCGDAILCSFVEQYGEKHASMRHIFEDMIDEKKVRDCALTQEQVLEVFANFEDHLSNIEEVGEFNRVRSAKESSSAGTYTFSFSLTDDTVELIKKERQKQREEERERAAMAGAENSGERPQRPLSSLAISSCPVAPESESESNSSLKEEDDSQAEDDESSPGRDGTLTPSSSESREKKKERKHSKKEGKKDKREKKSKKKKEGKKESKKDKSKTEKDASKKLKEAKKMLSSV